MQVRLTYVPWTLRVYLIMEHDAHFPLEISEHRMLLEEPTHQQYEGSQGIECLRRFGGFPHP